MFLVNSRQGDFRCVRHTKWHRCTVSEYSCVSSTQLISRAQISILIIATEDTMPFCVTEGLIPKVRPIFCRVPWSTLTRSPWSTRPDHLCRFAVRSYIWLSLEVFLGELFAVVLSLRGESIPPRPTIVLLKAVHRIFLVYPSQGADVNPIRRHSLCLA